MTHNDISSGRRTANALDVEISDYFAGADLFAGAQTLSFLGVDDIPPRAETVSAFCSPSGAATVAVVFYNDENKTTKLGEITASSSGSVIDLEVDVKYPHVEVEFRDDSGAANTANGSVYIR